MGAVAENSVLSILFGAPLFINALATIIPNLAAISRRLHNKGRSGWHCFFVIIPRVGAILRIVCLAEDSKPGHNQWGPNPKGIYNNNVFN
jgi:uncharacterized membrane protein YhaH (DUF805 family)